MSIERDRLLSIIEFAQQSARLRSKPAATVTEHGLFALYEHQMQGLPGIRVKQQTIPFPMVPGLLRPH
ncbi:MAG: hypothetical protein A3C53_03370 [Omnitrophica WOR_2 bacterium RIFCSPHIGHO2_02_FULL_68_15]|nr:MAG: hypothetical protein A3C53_03370 [Omnitrophica WOR_2 bacterium RIFCSPHIGHO2_02_FULL_68_15]